MEDTFKRPLFTTNRHVYGRIFEFKLGFGGAKIKILRVPHVIDHFISNELRVSSCECSVSLAADLFSADAVFVVSADEACRQGARVPGQEGVCFPHPRDAGDPS